MGLVASTPTPNEADANQEPTPSLNASLVQSLLPESASVHVTPYYDEGGALEELKLQFRLNGETVTLFWLRLRQRGALVNFVAALEAGADATLDGASASLAAKGSNLVFSAPALITHLPRALYAKPLTEALRSLN